MWPLSVVAGPGAEGFMVRLGSILLAVVALIMAACGADQPAAPTSPTVAADSVASTAAPEPSSLAEPTTTFTTSTLPDTTTKVTAEVILGFDGVGGAAFGESDVTTVATLTRLFGPPDEDHGWVAYAEIQPPFGVCGGEEHHLVRWGRLATLFTNGVPPQGGAPEKHFAMYSYGELDAAAGMSLATATGITIDDPVSAVLDAYGAMAIFVGEDEAVWPFVRVTSGDDTLVFGVEGDQASGTVAFIRGGYLCGE